LRESPNVASSFGVNVRAYTLFAFAVSGVYAGIAGALFAARRGNVVAVDFTFADIALPYLIVTVVGGLRRRGGIVLFAMLYVVGPLGPNGPGKTTCFNCTTGFYRPQSGRVLFKGEDVSHLGAHERSALGMGRNFQQVGLVKTTTVIDNLLTAQHSSVEYGSV